MPIPGTTKVKNLESNVKSLDVQLTDTDMKQLEDIVNPDSVHGNRYEEGHISWENEKNPTLSKEQEEYVQSELSKM